MSEPTVPAEQTEGSLLPAILGGGGILALAALLIFWPSGSDDDQKDGVDAVAAGAANAAKAQGKAQGGVAARSFDGAEKGERPEPRLNPAIKFPPLGMSPNPPPPKEPPVFETKDQELRWHEAELEKAERMLAFRKKAMTRLDKIREEIESSPDAANGMRAYEQRAKIVQDNLDAAKAEVERLKKKIGDLEKE